MYLNRLYFRSDNGRFITKTYLDDGGTGSILKAPSVDEDFSANFFLHQFKRDSVVVLELDKGRYEQDFNRGVLIGLDLKTSNLIFDYSDKGEAQNPTSPPLSDQINSIAYENNILREMLNKSESARIEDKLDMQIAIAELASIILGGDNLWLRYIST